MRGQSPPVCRLTYASMAGKPGLEPELPESEAGVLPLDDFPMMGARNRARSYFDGVEAAFCLLRCTRYAVRPHRPQKPATARAEAVRVSSPRNAATISPGGGGPLLPTVPEDVLILGMLARRSPRAESNCRGTLRRRVPDPLGYEGLG